MRKHYVFLVLLLAAIGEGLNWYAVRPQSAIEQLFGGSANVAVVGHPKKVEAFRIGPLPHGHAWDDVPISDYPVIAGPVGLSPEIATNASAVLLSPSTYVWDSDKSCIPAYGVRLSFIQDTDRVDVLLCFECDMLLVGRGDVLGGEDFDNGRLTLVRAAKAAFPDDEIIQQLEEN
jgi:hypothetical protein